MSEQTSLDLAGQPETTRIVSLDIFRGLTMTLMIFVNDLASVHGLSRWNYHMPTDVDAMSYVDMVFPAFLFIVGMAMPLAVRQRLARNPSLVSLWAHVLLRTFALVVIGLVLANGDLGDPRRMHGMPQSLWVLLGLAGSLLLWGRFGRKPADDTRRVYLRQGAGAALLVFCFAAFRRTLPDGHAAWIDFSYPEILGLIGFTYLGCSLLYIPFRRLWWMPVVWIVALLALDAGCMAHVISIAHYSVYVWPFDNGSMPAVTMAGVLAYFIFLDRDREWTSSQKIAAGMSLALIALLAGWLLMPFGISKNRGTPTWSLWSAAASAAVFTLLYWLCDVRRYVAWAAPVRSAGANTLFTYLLPDVYVYSAALFGFTAFLLHWNHGAAGVLRAVLFTCAMLALSLIFTRARVRMQL